MFMRLVLVNNAGFIKSGPLESVSLEDIDSVLTVNIRTVIIASQIAALHMPDGERIIDELSACFSARIRHGHEYLRSKSIQGNGFLMK
jgi:3-oxoacyl-[acyl-carrier protein] reductase